MSSPKKENEEKDAQKVTVQKECASPAAAVEQPETSTNPEESSLPNPVPMLTSWIPETPTWASSLVTSAAEKVKTSCFLR
jgi:hypothetical protein